VVFVGTGVSAECVTSNISLEEIIELATTLAATSKLLGFRSFLNSLILSALMMETIRSS
jgi:hypothetical protein